jgi:hypothetical protein
MANATGGAPQLHATDWAVVQPAGFDLDTFFIVQKGNLAVLHEAQALLADAIHAVARAQHVYLQQLRQDFSPLAAVGGGMSTAREVVELVADAQARIGSLLSRGLRLNLGG